MTHIRRALARPQRRSVSGFSLIEILVVLLVIVLLMGVALAIPKHEEREAQVRGAAEELAAVLRETRSRAIRKNQSYAVVFNIENAPGSSGKILNNRSGGHWYRVLGPADAVTSVWYGNSDGAYGNPPLFNPSVNYLTGWFCSWNYPSPLQHYLNLVSRCWIDEPHRLAKGKVRFLALTDQDNGDNYWPSNGTYYTSTYPRPWFGWWDSTTKEMHTWGGYDPTLTMRNFGEGRWPFTRKAMIVNGRQASHSAFYYEGFEGLITGCVNPADRMIPEDTNLDGKITQGFVGTVSNPGPTTPDELSNPTYRILKKDEPRPLINGNWVDFAILFHPDGSVETDMFRLRQGCHFESNAWANMPGDPMIVTYPQVIPPTPPALDIWASGAANKGWIFRDVGLGDMCNTYSRTFSFTDNSPYPSESTAHREATDYANRTGYYWISLAPDATNDNATFPSAEAALKAMLPLYRVGISTSGNVKVIRVRTTNYEGKNFDTAITGSDWEDKNKVWGKSGSSWTTALPTAPNYNDHLLWEANGKPRGSPVFDVVMPEMLRDRKWWWDN